MDVRDPLGEAEESAVDAQPVAGVDVVGLGGIGVAEVLGLSRREVAALIGGEREQPAPEISTIGDHSEDPISKLKYDVVMPRRTKDSM